MKPSISIAARFLLIAGTFAQARSSTVSNLSTKMAFLSHGEIWLADEDGGHPIQFTSTHGGVSAFLFSRDLQYLAFLKFAKDLRVSRCADDNYCSEEIPKYAIDVFKIPEFEPITEITPDDRDGAYELGWWVGDTKLIYKVSTNNWDQYSGLRVLDLVTRQIHPCALLHSIDTCVQLKQEVHFSSDQSEQVANSTYDKDIKIRDLNSNTVVLWRWKQHIQSASFSHNGTKIAYPCGQRICLFDLQAGSKTYLPAHSAISVPQQYSSIEWSPQDHYIGVFNAALRYFIVLNVNSQAPPVTLPAAQLSFGSGYSWIEEGKLIFTMRDGTICMMMLGGAPQCLPLYQAALPVYLGGSTGISEWAAAMDW